VCSRKAAKDDDRLLTAEGHELAEHFGSLLPSGAPVFLSHSPVPRCRETAIDIARGFSRHNPDVPATVLGAEPWLALFHHFSLDRHSMEMRKGRVGAKAFLREWLDGKLLTGIMHPASEVVESVLDRVVMALRTHKGPTLHIFVDHDFGLLLIREFLFGGKFEELPWIGNLDGFVLLMESQNTVRGLWWNQGVVSAPLRI